MFAYLLLLLLLLLLHELSMADVIVKHDSAVVNLPD